MAKQVENQTPLPIKSFVKFPFHKKMGQSRKGKSKETLKIRPYRPRRQNQTPKNVTKATPEPAQSEQPAPAPASPTSRSAPQREDFPESNATPTIVIEDDQADTNASHDKNKSSNDDEDDGNKKNRGSWTPEKQIVLLQKYAEHFPPGAPWGKSTEAWQKIVDSVNAVAPNDTPLRYDACRRAVDRISERYIEEASIKKAAIEALAKVKKMMPVTCEKSPTYRDKNTHIQIAFIEKQA